MIDLLIEEAQEIGNSILKGLLITILKWPTIPMCFPLANGYHFIQRPV